MRTRRTAALVAIIAVLAVLLGSPAAANASVIAPPPPIDDLKALPSQVKRGLTSAGGIGDDNIKAMAWLYGQMKAAVTTPPAGAPAISPPASMKPLTAPTTLARGAAGGPLIGAFTGGFALGTAGLEIYGNITGTDPFEPLCGSPFEGLGQVIYFGYMPECKAPVFEPNMDIPIGPSGTISGGGLSASYLGISSRVSSGTTIRSYCYAGTVMGSRPIVDGTYYYQYHLTNNGVVTWQNNASRPGSSASGADTACVAMGGVGSITIYSTDSTIQTNGTVRIVQRVNSTTTNVIGTVGLERKDVVRKPSCTIDWEDGTTTTGNGTDYKETQGLPLSTKGLGCKNAWDAKPGAGKDVLPKSIGIDSTDEGGAKTQIAKQPVPEFTGPQRDSLTAPSITEGLKLWKGKTSCMTWAADCASWWTNTEQGTVPGTGEYRCTFNTKAVDLSECSVYRETFDTRTGTPTLTDPDTGEQVEAPTKPEQGNSINPGTGPGTAGSPGDKCMAEWAAAPNPIDWVLHPIKCALVWAFVPRPTKVPEVQARIDRAMRDSFPGQLAIVLGGLGAAFGTVGEGGCSGIAINLANVGPDGKAASKPFRFMAACPGDFLAPFAPPVFWGSTAAIVIIGALGIKQQIDRFVNN